MNLSESFPRQRLFAVKEQRDRARFFLDLSSTATQPLIQFRLLLAALYFGRAMVELMLESARTDELVEGVESLEPRLVGHLPRYHLVEKIRIHDFHRHGVVPRPGLFVGGPIRIKARGANSGVQVQLTAEGPATNQVGSAFVVWNRPLQTNGGRILDEDTGEWLGLDSIVAQFLSGADAAVVTFEGLQKPEGAA